MPLEVKNILNTLQEWPHRGACTEEEMMAREQLVTFLEGEPGIDAVEEAFEVPPTAIPFFAMVCAAQLFAVWAADSMPYIALLIGTVFFVSYLLFHDGRKSPFIWFMPKKITANLVAKKGKGRRLFILMAHLDSAPASYAHRPDQIKHYRMSLNFAASVIGTGALLPLLATNGILLPVWFNVVISVLLIGQVIVASVDFWRFGFTPGANDNLSGVAAAVAAASRLWRRMPDNAEVRLVITSAKEAGMLGAQHYWQQHHEDFRFRDVYLINLDTVGCENLGFVTESGGFTPVFYQNELTDLARKITKQNDQFTNIKAMSHHVGDFDTIWFRRGNVPALTIVSQNDDSLMPKVKTPEDTMQYVDVQQVELASQYVEALVRVVPPHNG